ncbi:outer membrane beta-barrel protein [Sphingomonas sp. RB3P16]|uniref:outer membrane beta-barrel protein n=1 Tax=Parasphingomonas frigoris TaxID=3096163 RepID=UPI002FC727B2
MATQARRGAPRDQHPGDGISDDEARGSRHWCTTCNAQFACRVAQHVACQSVVKRGMFVKPAGTYGIALAMVLLASGPAMAQTADRGIGVADRARPDYDAVGQGLGSFLVYPSLTVRADATDNYRATDTNRLADQYLTLQPEVRVASNWNRNSLKGRAFFDQSFHAELPRENYSQYGATADGVLDITRQSVLNANVSAGHYVESRSSLGSFRNSREPVQYERYNAAIGAAHAFNRLILNASVGATYTNFHDVAALDGTTIDQDYRDFTVLIGTASAKYDIGGGLGLIVSGEANKSTYSYHPGSPGFNTLTTLDRQSSGATAQGGLTFELSSLVSGSAQIGILNRNYRDPRLKDFTGLSYSAYILWNVTPLTSLRFQAARSVEDTSSTTVAGNVRSDFSVGVDHELYRYIILAGNLHYGSFVPNGPGIGGKEYGADANVRYLIDRHWSTTLSAGYNRRDSASTFLRYHAATVGLAAKYAY